MTVVNRLQELHNEIGGEIRLLTLNYTDLISRLADMDENKRVSSAKDLVKLLDQLENYRDKLKEISNSMHNNRLLTVRDDDLPF